MIAWPIWERGSKMRWVVLVIGLLALLILSGCGGGQQMEPTIGSTFEPKTPETSALAYLAEMRDFASDIDQIFGREWPEALATEPIGDKEWQNAVSRLAARIDGLRFRMEEMNPPKEYRVSHKLIIDSLSDTGDAMRQVRIAGAMGDVEGLQEASATIEGALALLTEAVRQSPNSR